MAELAPPPQPIGTTALATTPPWFKRLLWPLLLGGLLLAAAAAWWFTRATPAAAVVVQAAPLLRTLQFSARVATASRVDLGATLTGRVVQVLVPQGAAVRAGDVLVRLETAELQAAVNQAVAGEQQALARLAGLRSTGRSGAQAAAAQAQAVRVAAQADLQRTQDLVARGFLSPARLDESERAVKVALAQQAAAQAQSSANAEQGTDLVQAQAQVALALAATQAARARLAQAEMKAPTDGKVLSRAVEPGQIVQVGRALMTLALAGPLQLVAPVDERYLQQLQVGQPAWVLADAFPEQRFRARVLSIAPLVDAQRGSVEVKFSVDGPPSFLREDMSLSVEVETARRESAWVVPLSALRGSPGDGDVGAASAASQATLWLEKSGRVEARAVRLGLRTLESVEVLQGLAAGDVVLVGPSPTPGRRVKAATAAPAATPQARGKAKSDDAGSAMGNAMGR